MMVACRRGDYESPKSEIVEVQCESGLCLSIGETGDMGGGTSHAHW